MSLKDKIVEYIMKTPSSSREIALALNADIKEVNEVLYSDKKFIHVVGIPPIWYFSIEKSLMDKPIDTVILLDLSNKTSILTTLELYAQAGEIYIYAFADKAYNGYPMQQKPQYQKKGIEIIRANSIKKNAADTLLIWHCKHIIDNRPSFLSNKLRFIIVSGDKGFFYLEDLVTEAGHSLIFCDQWDQIKMYI